MTKLIKSAPDSIDNFKNHQKSANSENFNQKVQKDPFLIDFDHFLSFNRHLIRFVSKNDKKI